MSWLTNKIEDLTKNPNSALNQYLDKGSVGEMSFDNMSLVKLGLSILVCGVVLMIFYKLFIK